MIVESKEIEGKALSWILRCPTSQDSKELSTLRVKIDGETENLDREPGEDLLTAEGFEKLVYDDSMAERNIFLVAEVKGRIVGYARCQGNTLSRFRHKAEFGICILKEYWRYGIGRTLLENVLIWAEAAGIKKLSLTVVETNTKAIQLYKSYDFVEEGLLVQDRIHRDGKYYNTVIMGKFLKR